MMFAGWRLRLTRPTKAVPVGPVSDAPPGFFYFRSPAAKSSISPAQSVGYNPSRTSR
ncbi:Uncharacterised protein [Enterobacter hormaechei]|nr:Uncharacterised protein [Enterobacter hormaechei]SAC97617.1 Uncharacterised protein [Enterobacter hormaechei]SAD12375.1 Uncharacterised protein [Enterobacter hormaechei]STP61406.1 Uncharacterised protein [Enterobacter hormaechei]VAK91603.1 Uncharacterised protein [Enterobacter hormaechei]